MILSVSRRTDIPAYYSDWFYNRIDEGYVMTRNPFNYNQISKINLSSDIVDCIVFWTKNPEPMLDRLDEIKDYNFYFQFTLNPYGKHLERNLPSNAELCSIFKSLSKKIGKNKVIWRYDPIIITENITKENHYNLFEKMAQEISNYTNKCVISFIDMYKKTKKNMKSIKLKVISKEEQKEIAIKFKKIADIYDLELGTCAENLDLKSHGIINNSCIDKSLIEEIIDSKLSLNKDKNQREECGCYKSVDIGAYNTCQNDCIYCYANYNEKSIKTNLEKHYSESPLLIGKLTNDDKIYERDVESNIISPSLFD